MNSYLEMDSKMKILIVDGDASNIEVMKRHLKTLGYQNILSVANGYEAMHFIRKPEHQVDYLFSRFHLEVMDGVELFSELKADLTIRRLPFTMFGEKLAVGDLELLRELEVDAFLTLPYHPKDMAERIARTWSKYIDPDNVEFHFENARKLYMQEEYEKGGDAYGELYDQGRQKSRSGIGKARCLVQMDRVDDAVTLCEDVTQADPKYVHGFQALGELLLTKEDYIGAVEAFMQAITISPRNPYRYEVVTGLLMELKLYEQAETVFKKAIEEELEFPRIWEGYAQTLIHLNKKKEAVTFFKRLSEEDPKSVRYVNNLAVCYKSLGDLNRAIQHYKKASDLDPENSRVVYNLALVYLEKGKNDEAERLLEQALKIEPGFERAQHKLAVLRGEDVPAPAKRVTKEPAEGAPAKTITKSVKVSEQARARLENIIQANEDAEPQPDPELAAKLAKVNPKKIQDAYFQSYAKIRRTNFCLMQAWFASVDKVSRQVSTDIIGLCESMMERKAMQSQKVQNMQGVLQKGQFEEAAQLFGEEDSALQQTLLPLVTGLQAQDYLRQSLQVIIQGYKATYNPEKPRDALKELKEFGVSTEHTGIYFREVLGEEPPEDGKRAGSMILF